jgi:hypothetical protein
MKMDESLPNGTVIKVPPSGPVATTSYQSSSIIDLNSDWPPKPVDGLKILGYEVQRFLGFVPLALDPDRFHKAGERLLKDAVVESACLHGRNVCGILLDLGDNREWKLRELLSGFKPDAEQQRKIKDLSAKLKDAWGRKDDQKSARFAFNMMVMHPSKSRGDYGVYDTFLRELAPIVQDLKRVIEELAGEFAPIE